MYNTDTFDRIRRELADANQDYSKAKNQINKLKQDLANHVLENGNNIEYYKTLIEELEFDAECSCNRFVELKSELVSLVNNIQLYEP